jgi:catechol 2,3-dioxygenase-like lactoylglutathione lyase family enzyme
MAIGLHHLHVKTRDPKQTMRFYVDNLGATVLAELPDGSYRLRLDGLQLNVTGIIGTQKREQHYGLEHVAVETDDYTGTLARFRASGARVLEELPPGANGRRVGFVEAPDGAQVEVIEKIG